MELALESPFYLTEELHCLVDYDFLLAHLVLQSEFYATFYTKSTNFKILDNSTNELGSPMSLLDIQQAANIVQPDYVCSPDYLGDAQRTLHAVRETCNKFSRGRILPIVQGSTIEEVTTFLEILKFEEDFDRVAIPYDILCSKGSSLEEMSEARSCVVSQAVDDDFGWIHLLGMNSIDELQSYKDYSAVQSIDTGSPITNGLDDRRFGIDEQLPKTVFLNFDSLKGRDLGPVYYNIAVLRREILQHNLD